MRRIETISKKHKKKSKNNTILGISLIFLMFFSVLAYGIGDFLTSLEDANSLEGNTIEYNGYSFTSNQQGFWELNKGGIAYYFSYLPTEVDSLNLNLSLESFENKPLFISPTQSYLKNEIFQNMYLHTERIQSACLEGQECLENFPIENCESNMIVFKESENSSFYKEKNCLFLEGQPEDLLKLSDSFLFEILEITQ